MNQRVRTGAMGASWRILTTTIGILLQIQALMSIKMEVVCVEGQNCTFKCKYSDKYKKNNKYFCLVDDSTCSHTLIRTNRHGHGRFSIFDNPTSSFFTVRMNNLTLQDSGTYWCGVDISDIPDFITVIQLNVTRAKPLPPQTTTTTTKTTKTTKNDPTVIIVPKYQLPLYLTAVMCVTAIFSVCIFTTCLLLVVKKQRSGPSRNREQTSDYETMVPGSRLGPELRCSCSHLDRTDPLALPPPPPDLCAHFKSEPRESVVSLSTEYVNMDVPGHVCQYQHLDPEHIEDHVYHCLHDNKSDKHEQPSESKEKSNV